MGNCCVPKSGATVPSVKSSELREDIVTRSAFFELEKKIRTGDLALLYGKGKSSPHFAVFVKNDDDTEEHFPLLLVKEKTKDLPLESFKASEPRHAHLVTAAVRIFYGDYEKVAVRHLLAESSPSTAEAMEAVERVNAAPFTAAELERIQNPKLSPTERSLYVTTFMIANLYKELSVLPAGCEPSSVTPETLQDSLKLSEPMFVELPPIARQPPSAKNPPFLTRLVDGLLSTPDVKNAAKYDEIAPNLRTGDIVLLSGAEIGGAVIKIFDKAEFSHVALVVRSTITSELFIYESTPNNFNSIDVVSGKVLHGVQLLPLRYKVFSGYYNRVAVRQLTDITEEQRKEMLQQLLKFRKEVEGRPYEKKKLEAIMAAFDFYEDTFTFLKNTEEDLSSIFCSELVAAAYQRMGLLGSATSSNEYTPDDFATARSSALDLRVGRLEPEVYIDLC